MRMQYTSSLFCISLGCRENRRSYFILMKTLDAFESQETIATKHYVEHLTNFEERSMKPTQNFNYNILANRKSHTNVRIQSKTAQYFQDKLQRNEHF